MDYNLKVKINGVEILEYQEELAGEGFIYTAPSISSAELINGVSTGTMDIGSSVSDALTFTLLNPHKQSFDGDTVEFYVSPAESDELTTKERIENQVGSDASQDVISDDEFIFEIEETSEEGEDATAEDLADAAAVDFEINNAQDAFFEGVEEEVADEETDGGEEAQWRKVGTYYVYSQNDVNGGVMLTCYDGFIKMHGDFKPSQKTATAQVMFDDLRSQVLEKCGIVIEPFEFPANANITITWDFICNYRRALGYFAGIVGGFATFDPDGVANISFYTFSDNIIIDSDLIAFKETSTGEMLLDGIQCRCSVDGADGDLIEAGAGQSISFINPFMKEAMLGDIYSLYRGIRFEGATVAAWWDDSLIAGEFARIFTEKEYKAYIGISNSIKEASDSETVAELKADLNTLGKVILISSQIVNFTGDATTVIKSVCGSETMKENQPDSDLLASLKQANKKIDEAANNAKHFIQYDSITGKLYIGNKIENDWYGFRTQMASDSFNVLDQDGNVCSSFGAELIELGKESDNAVISFCNGTGQLTNKNDADGNYKRLGIFSQNEVGIDSENFTVNAFYEDKSDLNNVTENSVTIEAFTHLPWNEETDPFFTGATAFKILSDAWNVNKNEHMQASLELDGSDGLARISSSYADGHVTITLVGMQDLVDIDGKLNLSGDINAAGNISAANLTRKSVAISGLPSGAGYNCYYYPLLKICVLRLYYTGKAISATTATVLGTVASGYRPATQHALSVYPSQDTLKHRQAAISSDGGIKFYSEVAKDAADNTYITGFWLV